MSLTPVSGEEYHPNFSSFFVCHLQVSMTPLILASPVTDDISETCLASVIVSIKMIHKCL